MEFALFFLREVTTIKIWMTNIDLDPSLPNCDLHQDRKCAWTTLQILVEWESYVAIVLIAVDRDILQGSPNLLYSAPFPAPQGVEGCFSGRGGLRRAAALNIWAGEFVSLAPGVRGQRRGGTEPTTRGPPPERRSGPQTLSATGTPPPPCSSNQCNIKDSFKYPPSFLKVWDCFASQFREHWVTLILWYYPTPASHQKS